MPPENSWIAKEFSDINITDKRLTSLFINVAKCMMESPGGSINQSTKSWSEAKAAYRMFDNANLNRDEILNCHRQNTLCRAEEIADSRLY